MMLVFMPSEIIFADYTVDNKQACKTISGAHGLGSGGQDLIIGAHCAFHGGNACSAAFVNYLQVKGLLLWNSNEKFPTNYSCSSSLHANLSKLVPSRKA